MATIKRTVVEIAYHKLQALVFNFACRFKVIAAGRRWGKTRGAIQWLVQRTLRGPDRLGWWVSPTYRQAKIAYRYFKRMFHKSGIIVGENKADLTVDLKAGCRLEFRSAEIPDNLRGEGVDELVVDEAASMAEMVWYEVLRPMLIDSKGEAVFIGTPKGQNWFHVLFHKGHGQDPDWKSWSFSTYDNPFLDKREIEKAESELPELVAKQEIHAEFIETGGTVFRNVDACATSKPEEPKSGQNYQLGVDLAKYQDFTAVIGRNGKRMVYMDRFNKIDWAVQRPRISLAANRYNTATVVMDSTGVGDPIYEALKYERVRVTPYQLTSVSKSELINNLIIKFDNKDIEIFNDPVLISELKAFTYEMTSSGRLKMQAPSGRHDDCVIALALAFWGAGGAPAQRVIRNPNPYRAR